MMNRYIYTLLLCILCSTIAVAQTDNIKRKKKKATTEATSSAKPENPKPKENKPKSEPHKTTVKPETKPAEQPSEPAPTASPRTTGKHTFAYGVYEGSLRDNKPDGKGRLDYTDAAPLDPRDTEKRMAAPGDYVIGQWSSGKLVQGRWYDSDGTPKGIVIIGL